MEPETVGNADAILRLLFEPTLTKFRLSKLNIKSIIHSLRNVYTNAEFLRLLLVLHNLPSTGLSRVEEEVLRDYRKEVMECLHPGHLFIALHNEFQIIRRPEVFEVYNYMGNLFLALSERKLAGVEGGRLRLFEIAEFEYLPKKNRTTAPSVVQEAWNLSAQEVNDFIDQNYCKKPHLEQADLFHDGFVMLRYDRNKHFVEAFPKPGAVPTISSVKGQVL